MIIMIQCYNSNYIKVYPSFESPLNQKQHNLIQTLYFVKIMFEIVFMPVYSKDKRSAKSLLRTPRAHDWFTRVDWRWNESTAAQIEVIERECFRVAAANCASSLSKVALSELGEHFILHYRSPPPCHLIARNALGHVLLWFLNANDSLQLLFLLS